MSATFAIKHMSSGRFFHPKCGSSNPRNDTEIVLHSDVHTNMHWKFVLVKDHWGYIEHVASGKIIHPRDGRLTPGNDTGLVVHNDRHWGALFALDAVNHHVIHKGGKFAHPYGGRPGACNGTEVVLHSDVHAAMEFCFVSPWNVFQEVLVYGAPKLAGKWKIVHKVLNPTAGHQFTLQVKVGKSTIESKTKGFKYSWETSDGVQLGILNLSASMSMKLMMEQTSSQTWSDETTTTYQITVNPGKTDVTWQWVFDVKQNETKSVFQSNLLANTDSETEVPKDHQYKV